MEIIQKIRNLTRQLYPTGRAFKIPLFKTGEISTFDDSFDETILGSSGIIPGVLAKLHNGLAESEKRLYDASAGILNSALPDNADFTVNDATDWERRLGLVHSTALLADRELAIIRKMNHPGDTPARQHFLYLQGQLQAAGFNVFVHENRFDDGMGGFMTKEPADFSLIPYPTTAGLEHSDEVEHGDVEHGGGYDNQVANSIYQSEDDAFLFGDNLRESFFIGGEVPGSWANVDADREMEFRQLILKTKPTQTVAFLLINYI